MDTSETCLSTTFDSLRVDSNVCMSSRPENGTFFEELENKLREIALTEGFDSYKIKRNRIETKGGSYLGILYKVIIDGFQGKTRHRLEIFIKTTIPDENANGLISVHDVYSREMLAYEKLAAMYKYLQIKAKIPEHERFQFVHCYGFLKQKNKETMIMDDLGAKGYEVHDRTTPISLAYAEAGIRKLATYHALSFVFELSNPDEFNKEFRCLRHFSQQNSQEWRKLVDICQSRAMDVLDRDELKTWVKINFTNAYDRYSALFGTSKGSVICHGDYRGNNILVQYNKDGKLVDFVPIDYQIIHYGPAVNDLYYFIYSATEQSFRKSHLEGLIELYYETLTNYLKNFKIDVNDVYPRKLFDEDLLKYRFTVLMTGVMTLQFILVNEDDAPDMGEIGSGGFLSDLSLEKNQLYKHRMTEIIEECMQWSNI